MFDPIAVLQALPDAVFILTETGTVGYVNPAVTDIFGYQPEELVDGSFEVLVPPELLEVHRAARRQFIDGPPEQRISGQWSVRDFVHKDGRRIPVSGSVSAAMTTEGRRVVVTLRRAGDVEREALVAAKLQEDLMLVVPTRVGAARIATRSVTAETAARVGGDWTDAFELPDGRIGLVVGDVAGHGAEAAITMVRLQTSIRMFATSGARPASVLTRVNQGLHDLEAGDIRMATVVHAQLDPATGILAYSSAGHLPMIMLPPGRSEATPVPSAGGPPLGVVDSYRYTEHALGLASGSLLVGFTDGLIERQDKSLDETLLELLQGISRLPEPRVRGVEDLADAILELAPERGDERHQDEVAVMVVGFHPEHRTKRTLLARPPLPRHLQERWSPIDAHGASTQELRGRWAAVGGTEQD